MAIYDFLEEINLGTVVNDGTGDDLHEAFRKVKDSIEYLYDNSNIPVTGLNLGSGSQVFSAKVGGNLEFRTLVAGTNISLVQSSTSITVSTSGTLTANLTGNVTGNLTGNVTGLVHSSSTEPLVNVNDLDRTINTFDYGSLTPTFTNPVAYLLQEIGTDMGTLASPSPVSIDAGTI